MRRTFGLFDPRWGFEEHETIPIEIRHLIPPTGINSHLFPPRMFLMASSAVVPARSPASTGNCPQLQLQGFNWLIFQTDLPPDEERLWGFLTISPGSCAASPDRTSTFPWTRHHRLTQPGLNKTWTRRHGDSTSLLLKDPGRNTRCGRTCTRQ